MRSKILFYICASAALGSSGVVSGQEGKAAVKVEIKAAAPTIVQTPQFMAPNVGEKKWRPKGWLELDVDFVAKKAKTPGDPSTVIDSLEIKVFIGLAKPDAASKKFTVLTGTMNALNIAGHGVDHSHLLAFISPSALLRLTDNANFNANSDIKGVGVEINFGGVPVGYYSLPPTPYPQRWWADLSKFNTVDGVLLPKVKTPFAPLWGDYDVEVKQ